MIDKAIEKITKEAMEIDDPVAFGIEEHLTEICTTNTVALRILDDEKKLKEIYDKVWNEARKRKKGNCAFIPPQEVYEMVDEYYGLGSVSRNNHRGEAAGKVNVLDLI